MNTQTHYKGDKSLYFYSEIWGLNSYEFDIVKRVSRCRFKGQFESDLRKSIDVLDIYEKEYSNMTFVENNYNNLSDNFIKEKELNTYEIEIINRIIRCRFDSNYFIEDLRKIKMSILKYLEDCENIITIAGKLNLNSYENKTK